LPDCPSPRELGTRNLKLSINVHHAQLWSAEQPNLYKLLLALKNIDGQIFAIFVITDAVAEAAVGLGILIALFRNKETVLADEVDLLKW